MKKLLVLAALSAMAFGAQAEFTVNIPGAKAVYAMDHYGPKRIVEESIDRGTVEGGWENLYAGVFSPQDLSEAAQWAAALELPEPANWDEYYASLSEALSSEKFSGSEGSFSSDMLVGAYGIWGILALEDESLTRGGKFTFYYGTTDSGSGAIDIDFDKPIASGFLSGGSPTPAPEPTSGLLLLLGVAGLALKRKRA